MNSNEPISPEVYTTSIFEIRDVSLLSAVICNGVVSSPPSVIPDKLITTFSPSLTTVWSSISFKKGGIFGSKTSNVSILGNVRTSFTIGMGLAKPQLTVEPSSFNATNPYLKAKTLTISVKSTPELLSP